MAHGTRHTQPNPSLPRLPDNTTNLEDVHDDVLEGRQGSILRQCLLGLGKENRQDVEAANTSVFPRVGRGGAGCDNRRERRSAPKLTATDRRTVPLRRRQMTQE